MFKNFSLFSYLDTKSPAELGRADADYGAFKNARFPFDKAF